MKTTYLLLFITVLIFSCKNDQKLNAKKQPVDQSNTAEKTHSKTENEGTYLCKVNGKNWYFTKASGIVSTNKKTGKRTAIITFKKQLEKGNESIQLTYDGDNHQLERATVQLKFPDKEGGNVHGIYRLSPEKNNTHPQSGLSGAVDLSNKSRASGNAELTKLKITLRKEKLLKNPEDAIITVTDLTFSEVDYSDLNRLFKN